MPKKRRIHWDEAGSVGENARAQLPSLVGGYFRSGRKLMTSAASPEDLHAFRLKTKRLRYTLELFRPCYGSTLEQRLEELRAVQTILGDISDCHAALRIAARSLKSRSAEFRKLKRYLDARSARLTAAFRKHWREKFDAAGREDWWTGHLARRR
jgi:CHAD domain-containing protein